MTLDEMEKRIRRLLKPHIQGRFNSDQISDEINRGLDDFCANTFALTKTKTFSALQYKRDYDLPADFLDMKNVYYDNKKLYYKSEMEMNDYFGTNPNEMARTGTPIDFWFPLHGRFALHPLPDSDRIRTTAVFLISSGAATFVVASTSGFNDSGFFLVSDGSEVVHYFNKSTASLGSELVTDSDNRDFTAANEWANVDFGVGYADSSGTLGVEADASGQYATLPVANAPMTAGSHYILEFDASSLTSTLTLRDFTGAQTFGTISAAGSDQKLQFVLNSGLTGGFRLVAEANDSAVTLDNFSLTEVKNEFKSIIRGEEETSAETVPSEATITEQNIQIVYYAMDKGVSASTDSPQLTREYHAAIIDYVVAELLSEFKDEIRVAERHRSRYLRIREEAKGDVKRQQKTTLARVRDTAFGGSRGRW